MDDIQARLIFLAGKVHGHILAARKAANDLASHLQRTGAGEMHYARAEELCGQLSACARDSKGIAREFGIEVEIV